MDDEDLMREILAALIDDTSVQIHNLETAIREQDPSKCARLAHYSKGACANVGANRAATVLKQIEREASSGHLQECGASLATLAMELDRLRGELK